MSDTELKQGDDEWIFFFYLGNCAMTFGYPYGKKIIAHTAQKN